MQTCLCIFLSLSLSLISNERLEQEDANKSSGSGFNDAPALDPVFYNQIWMDSVPDETPLSAITIPGTHDSLSLYGGPLAECQVWTLEKQLNVGIRYFDVHAGIWLPNQKLIYIRDSHWMFWQRTHLDEVLSIMTNYLDSHRSETVLLKVSLHGILQDKVAKLLMELIKKYTDKIWTGLSVPTMKQARGKIVFLHSKKIRVGAENHKSHFFENDQLKNVEVKISHIRSHFCGHYIVVTENAASLIKSPKTLAQKVNKQIFDLVEKHKKNLLHQRCLGVLSLNFPSADLIKAIVGTETNH
uniref:Phosphatidylinositol-specific phospholipase C X domain-containing protein n=1 Tax=Mastacembelus armatus TaxID=205130 RepID=A0A7N8XMK6_9TELE